MSTAHRRGAGIVAAVVAGVIGSGPAAGARTGAASPSQLRGPSGLTVQERVAPLGVDRHAVDFGWLVSDGRRGARQTAYQVVVSTAPTTDPAAAGVLWDSGVVSSDQQAFVAYRGPELGSDHAYFWTVRTWDGAGTASPYAAPARFETGLDDSDWHADWIRRASATPDDEQYSYARKQVTLAASPIVRARAYTSAAHQDELFVNGQRASQGPAFANPDRQYYQTTDVTGLLRPGVPNVIGLLGHWYGAGKGHPAAAPGLIARVSIEHRDGTRETITTDGSWRTRAAEWKSAPARNDESGDHVEIIDQRAYPTGWDRPGYDDRSWEPATVVGAHPTAPWTHLVAQTTHIAETRITPVSLTHLSSGAYVADFGQIGAAVPVVTFRDGRAGRHVKMHAGDLLDPGGEVSVTVGTQNTDMSYEYDEARGTHAFRPFLYLGFRYFEVENPGSSLQPGDVVAYARHSAMPDEHAASFVSGNRTLDAVWRLARHSALFGAQEQFIDTPTREKGPFLNDAFNISATTMRAFGERNLTQQAITDFATSQARYWPDGRVNAIDPAGQGKRDIPDYTESFPEWVWRYYLDTGDQTRLRDWYPVLKSIADYVARYIDPTTGVVTNLAGGDDTPAYTGGLVDNPPAMRYGYDMGTAARTTVNALAVNVFRRVAQADAVLGHPDDAALEQTRQADLTAAINARLTRPDGTYTDGLEPGGAPSPHASQFANAFALAYGIVPPAHVAGIADALAGETLQMGPLNALTMLRALHAAGRDAALVRLLTDRKHDGWANILSRGATFTWESWKPKETEGDSYSHGWGANVLVSLQEALLGVTPAAPDFARFTVEPPTGGLTRASGRVPTDRGPIVVSWRTARRGPSVVAVQVPPNTTAVVSVPTTDARRVTEGGRAAATAPGVHLLDVGPGVARYEVGAGGYTFRSPV